MTTCRQSLFKPRPGLLPAVFLALVLLVAPVAKARKAPSPADDAPQMLETVGPVTDETTTTTGEKPAEDEAKTLFYRGVELFQIAQIQAEKGNQAGQKDLLREAVRTFEKALALEPAMVEAQSNIGFAWLTLQEHRKAVTAFQKALVTDPRHLNTLNGLATAQALGGDIDGALETFDRLTTLDPGNAQYFFNKGSALQKANREEEAARAYEEALRIDAQDQRALFNLATLYENARQMEKALDYYEKAKAAGISTPVGLEAVRRLEALEARVKAEVKAETGESPKQKGRR